MGRDYMANAMLNPVHHLFRLLDTCFGRRPEMEPHNAHIHGRKKIHPHNEKQAYAHESECACRDEHERSVIQHGLKCAAVAIPHAFEGNLRFLCSFRMTDFTGPSG